MATSVVWHALKPRISSPDGLKTVARVRRLATVSDALVPQAIPRPKKACFGAAAFKIKDGPTFYGNSFGAMANASGEAVFTTSLVGYPESMTDPSYRKQILVFTQPLIGNYGVPSAERDTYGLLRHFESSTIQTSGIVVGDVALQHSHWTAVQSLSEWCAQEGVPGISGVDTREIVKFLRDHGSSRARIDIDGIQDAAQDWEQAYEDPAEMDLIALVSTRKPFHVLSGGGLAHIALIDCGVKENIIRSLVSRGMSVTCLPYDFPIHTHAHEFDGVFISNGPGDPTRCKSTSGNLRQLMNTSNIPIMGICLGHQLLAIAAGARTSKMRYGNRAHNIPNHGYAVDASTLPSDFQEHFVNLNDGSNEGIIHRSRPIFSTQFHPEAKGGPLDTSYLFHVYLEHIQKYNQNVPEYSKDRRSSPGLAQFPLDLNPLHHGHAERAESLS
ncbi:Multifunctional pyrimidine synthesis protein CAD [Vermiconidia calcicola]|uniref:Multifunctional pyrimidine synthesis protein CAD n=1 Tax=Vermiconidia calcicola TaxID=1690605 RepID=A0ACC3N0R8_9PEZI|nr:Multifunctional pyrimidine synthesis protein CAD [Vermiconidia calcicola]